MFVRNWGKSLFCVLLVCVVFLSLSFSFAAEDMDLSLEDNYEDNVDLSVSNDEVCSDLKCSSDSDENVLEDDGDEGDDGAFNEDDPWVENLEEDSHDEEFEFISGFEPGIGPGMNPMDNRASTKLVVSSFSKYYRNGTQLVGFLQDASNNPLVGKTVKINIANANYTRTTDENGGFRLNINLKPNNYTSTISFAGDSSYKPSSKTITVKVFTMPTSITSSNLVKYYRNASQLVAQLKDVHGNPLVGKNITITILGNVYQRATDDDGYIHMNINMHPRVCNATLNFTENGYVSSKKVVSITVLEMPTSIVSSNLVKYYRNGSYWVARLLDGNGNPLAGKTLTFNIVNHNYTRLSDADGYCYMTINLQPGVYDGIVSFCEQYYGSSSKSVSITVLEYYSTIITANDVSYVFGDGTNLNIFLSDENGSPLANKLINITGNDFDYSGITDSQGKVHFDISNKISNSGTVCISFAGDSNHNSSFININVIVSKLMTSISVNNFSKYYFENKTLVSTLIDGMHRPISNKSLFFHVNDETFSGITDNEGNVNWNIDLNPGNYSAYIQFLEDPYCIGSVKNFSIVVHKENTNIKMFTDEMDNGTFFRFVLSDNLNNTLSNKPIDLFLLNDSDDVVFNDSFVTDDFGEIILFENFNPNNYSILVVFNGSDIYNGVFKVFSVGDINAPIVWASRGSGFNSISFDVELNALDDTDNESIIYYTVDGSLPTENSEVYSIPIHIYFRNTVTNLRFFAVDRYGHRSDVVNVYYFFGSYVANLNSGKYFDDVQSAIDDNDTIEGDVIEVNKDLSGNCVLNKTVYLRSSGLGVFTWSNTCINVASNGCVIDGFKFYLGFTAIYLSEVSNCMICNNDFDGFKYGIWSSCNNLNNIIINNNFSSHDSGSIAINLIPFINEVNTVLIKDNIFNFSYCGVALEGSMNSIIMDNVFYNSSYGIHFFGDNSSLIGNSFISHNVGAVISGDNAYIYSNNFTLNSYGLKLYGNNGSIISNNIVENGHGVFSPNPDNLCVNFNRIASNSVFGLKVNSGNVNATNNWWGQNNVSVGSDEGNDIFYSDNLEIIYEPYIILRSYLSYYELKDMIVENVTCVVDLNFNNFDEYVPHFGSLPDGFNVRFVDIKSGPYPRFGAVSSGQAKYTTFASFSSSDIIVTLDNEVQNVSYASYQNSARFYVNTSAVIIENSTSLNVSDNYYTYDVIFNDSVDWVSFIWRYLGDFRSEVSLVVDGEILESYIVESSFYHDNPLNFSSNVFEALNFYNDICYNKLSWAKALAYVYISLDNNRTTLDEVIYDYTHANWRSYSPELQHQLLEEHNTTFKDALLDLIQNSYNLTDDEINFIYENHSVLRDDIHVSLHYYGDDNTFLNYDVFNENQLYYTPAMITSRNGTIMFVNGSYAHFIDNNLNESVDIYTYYHNHGNGSVDWESGYSYGNYSQGGYDGLMTFTFANDKVDSDVLSYWLNESNRTDMNGSLIFGNGFMKAVYGSFLEGLLVIYVDDLLADVAAFNLGVSWERVSPMVMSVRDDHFRTIMSGESSSYFGRKVLTEDEDIRKAFYFACSASFSPIEFYVHQTLFPGIIGGAVTVDFGNCLLNGSALRIEDDGRYVYIFENSSDVSSYLCFDRMTGLFMDGSWLGSAAYCYSNQQTGWACDLAGELLDNSGLIWDYLTGNGGDISGLNGSTQGLLKTCNGMGILSGLFGGAYLSDLSVLIGSVGLEDSFASIVPLIGVVSSGIGSFSDYLYDSASDPHFWAGVAGSMLFEAGMIASCTGVGLPVGLALMGVGTVCTAYSSGLFGFTDTGNFYTNATGENWVDFGVSMGLNVAGGGLGASAAKSTLKKCGGEAVQISISRAVYAADQRGAYTTFHTLSSSQYVRKVEGGSLYTGGQYLVDEVVGTTTKEKLIKSGRNIGMNSFTNYVLNSAKTNFLTDGYGS